MIGSYMKRNTALKWVKQQLDIPIQTIDSNTHISGTPEICLQLDDDYNKGWGVKEEESMYITF